MEDTYPVRAGILYQVREIVRPLAAGQYIDDWDSRAAAIGLSSEACALLARENGHWSNREPAAPLNPFSLSPARSTFAGTSGVGVGVGDSSKLSLNFEFGELAGRELGIVQSAAARLDAAEKIVVSATARSLHDLDNPPELTIDLMNILYEEALHLEAVSRLLGLDQAEREWIPADRQPNWQLVKECSTPLEYMLLEHCLYEGRGTIASAAGAHDLERAGVSKPVVAVMDAISMQEAAHNITGFRWLRLLDTGAPEIQQAMASVVRKFISVEPLPDADGSPRSTKKHFPLYLLQIYRDSGDFYKVKEMIVAASKAARTSGQAGVPTAELYAATAKIMAWSEQARD